MPHSSVPTPVPTFVISLERDRHRRDALGAQLRELGMPFSVVDAVHGASLSAAELHVSYDEARAQRQFNRRLSKGEIGCALSHLKVYRMMVEQDIPHALVLEDDAWVLDRRLGATLARLAALYAPATPVAVMLNHVRRVDGRDRVQLDAVHGVCDAYRGVCTHGYFLTRAAAEALLRNLYPVHVVADKWEYFQERYIAVKALVPYAVGLAPSALGSSIEGMGTRVKKRFGAWSWLYYLRKYAALLADRLRPRAHMCIEVQDKSPYDLQ